MRPLINLASEPFRNRRLFWLIMGIIIFIASLFGVNSLDTKAKLDNQIVALEPSVHQLEEKVKNSNGLDFSGSSLTIAQNQALLAAQDLIVRKGFSWSQLLNDLERFVPATVRVTRIAVDKVNKNKITTEESNDNAVFLSFDVIGKSSTAVTQMISELNRSAKFAVNPKSMKPVEGTEEVEFQLQVEYRPATFTASPSSSSSTQVASRIGEVQK